MSNNSLQKTPPDIRLRKIRRVLQDQERVDIVELAETFGVSQITVRRDLEKLEQHGHVQRTTGGAIPAERMAFDFNFAQRRQSLQKEKQAIAREAFRLIQPGHRLILDTGTTTLELAYLLKDSRDVTVITPSLAVASVLQFSRDVQTILLGGIFRQGSADLTGSVTESNLDMFAVDIVFQGADGIGLDGTIYNADLRLARVDQKMRQRAASTCILADSSKIGQTALVTNGYLQQVDALITDEKIEPEQEKTFREIGATIITVAIQR
jgi:DeoR/GlpR family transcriptional regulator of sugar metabolism